MKTTKELINESKLLKTDLQRWKWVIENKNEENLPPIMLDNDDTFICFHVDDGNNVFLQFDEYIGNSDGIDILLDAIGIKCEGV